MMLIRLIVRYWLVGGLELGVAVSVAVWQEGGPVIA